MTSTKAGPSERLLKMWHRLSPLPGGRWLFSFLLGRLAPYTGSIGAQVKDLRPGYARIEMRDRHRVRNHLNSIHAIALMNLGEVTTGLALLIGLKPGVRGIIVGLSIEYFKKARGRMISVAETNQPEVLSDIEHEVIADITNQSGEIVARCTAKWRLGLIQ